MNEPTALLTIPEVADLLNVKERYIRHLVAQKRIPYVKIGRHLRFHPHAIREFVESSAVPATGSVQSNSHSSERGEGSNGEH